MRVSEDHVLVSRSELSQSSRLTLAAVVVGEVAGPGPVAGGATNPAPDGPATWAGPTLAELMFAATAAAAAAAAAVDCLDCGLCMQQKRNDERERARGDERRRGG